jgi:hypothetical protein
MTVFLCFLVASGSAFILGSVSGYVSGQENERRRWRQYSEKVQSLCDNVQSYLSTQHTDDTVISDLVAGLSAGLQQMLRRGNKPGNFEHGSN